MNSQPPVQYVLARACWDSLLSGTTGEGVSQTLTSGDTLTWDLGYTLGVSWTQVQGGDVYASASMRSFVPASNVFILDGAGGSPGVAIYGQDYNFDSSGLTHGATRVSTKNWLANDTVGSSDYYQILYRQFGGAPSAVDYDHPASSVPQPTVRTAPYYVTGNMTTSGVWTAGLDQKVVVFVDGNLTIGGNITITNNGFITFIVNGNITVDPSVSEVDGIYITAPPGTFSTGAGDVRLVGTGMFAAGSFLMQRDMGDGKGKAHSPWGS